MLGLGASGESAARLLRTEGRSVTIFDERPSAERAAVLTSLGATVIAASAETAIPDDSDLCVLSPGVSSDHPWVRRVRERGIEVVPEFEFGWSRLHARVVAVTGTNGKSTAVKFAAELLQAAGLRVAIGGNYGVPVCRIALERSSPDWLVLELSSFQLEAARAFRAEVGILLNLAPNHLDRHGTMENYIAAKARLFARVGEGDHGLAPREWMTRMRETSSGRGAWHTFGSAVDDEYCWRAGGVWHLEREVMDLRGTYFDNPILGVNAAAVAGGLCAAGIPLGNAKAVAHTFKPLPHRMELVAEADGVRYVNDSKATTLTAVGAALKMAGGPTRLIAGGLLKETDLNGVKEMLALHARGVYLIGKAAKEMSASWSDVVLCRMSGTLEQAMVDASNDAQPGEIVLLSPGCASFDQFKNFEERGEIFRRTAVAMAGERVQ
ncbi:MAG: UDP-N-acetylmuramoyl-L-alanine--D-glutamate ligase [Kiritimatiellae bacterium]|nr:UDP-N-acetylmuramoyl-L-alanine--D-glutamate ligase [Kiritimatiellia bacterium]